MIFINFIMMIFTFSSVQTVNPLEDFSTKFDFVHNAEEYVRLNLVDRLLYLNSMDITLSERRWLFSWKNKRDMILTRVLLSYDQNLKSYKWFLNWRHRLQYFQELQTKYLQTIVDKYYVYDESNKKSIWPKIKFNPDDLKTTMIIENFEHSRDSIERDLFDPIVSKDDIIDQVLRFHRPFSDVERAEEASKKLKQPLLETHSSSYLVDDETLEKFSNVKKYYVVSQEKIKKLMTARYVLLKKSLKGKRMSELDYQKRLFNVERIIAQFDAWEMLGINYVTISSLVQNAKKNYYLKLISDDKLYRKYLNFDELFFNGHIFWGFKNRFDDPAKHGLDFDVNAKLIMGKNFYPLLEISNVINEFEIRSNGFTQYELKDLPKIDSCLERFKTFTFWFSKRELNKKQWFQVNLKSTEDLFVIKPYPLNWDLDYKFIQVFQKLEEAKNPSARKVDTNYEFSQNFPYHVYRDSFAVKNLKAETIKWSIIWTNRIEHYVNSLQRASLSPLLSSSSNLVLQKQTLLSQHQLLKIFDVTDSDSNKNNNKRQYKDSVVDKLKTVAKDSLNPDSNFLMHENHQYSKKDVIRSTSFLSGTGVVQNQLNFGSGGDSDDTTLLLSSRKRSSSHDNDGINLKLHKHF